MDESYLHHLKTIKAEDGNYQNTKDLLAALAYFFELQQKGADLEFLFADLLEIYDNAPNNINILDGAAKLFLKLALKNGRVSEILPLLKKSYGYYSIVIVISKMATEGADIYPLFPVLYAAADKDKHGILGAILSYFDCEKHASARKDKRLETALKLAELNIPTAYTVNRILYKDFPLENIKMLKRLLDQKVNAEQAIDSLRSVIPEHIDIITDLLPKIKKIWLTKGETKPYSANDFLLKYAYFDNNESLIEELVEQTDSYLAQKCMAQLGALCQDNLPKARHYLHYYLTQVRTDDNWTVDELRKSFLSFFKNGLKLTDSELNGLLEDLTKQGFVNGILNVIELYGSATIENKEQLLLVIKSAKFSPNPYIEGLNHYFNGEKEKCCPFCSIQRYHQVTDFPENREKFLKTICGTETDTVWQKCMNCGQDYLSYYYEEVDVNSLYVSESLTKTNPAALIKIVLDLPFKNLLNETFADLEKAKTDFYSPLVHLRTAAAVFLFEHAIQQNDLLGMQKVLKYSCTESLKQVFENYKWGLKGIEQRLLEPSDFEPFLEFESCCEVTANILGQMHILDKAEALLLKRLNNSNAFIKKGCLWAIFYPPAEYHPHQQILEAVYHCGIEAPAECEHVVQNILSKYGYKAKENSIFSLMQLIEQGTDLKSVNFALHYVNSRIAELPSFNEVMIEKLLIYTSDEDLKYAARQLLLSLLRERKLTDDGLKKIFAAFKQEGANFGYDTNTALFSVLKQVENPYLWLEDLKELLVHRNVTTAKSAGVAFSELSARGISIEVLIPVLTELFNTMDDYENEQMIYAATDYYHQHKSTEMTAFLDRLPNDRNRGAAVARIADFAYYKKGISRYYDWLAAHIFAKQYYLKDSCRKAIYYALKHKPEDEEKIEKALQSIAAKMGLDLKVLILELKKY